MSMRAPLTLKLMFSYVLVLALCSLPSLLPARVQPGVAQGAAASVALLFGLLILTQLALPLLRVQRDLLALARGEYNLPPRRRLRDEIGDVQAALDALAHTLQRERVLHSADDALRAELCRVLPLPVLLLSPSLGLRHVNAAFREYAGLDPATEGARLHALCQGADFATASVVARQTRDPVALAAVVPWRRDPLRLRLCPLPAPQGEVGWALLGDVAGMAGFALRGDWTLAQSAALAAAHEILSRLHATCVTGPSGDALTFQRTLRARVVELKTALAAAEPEEIPVPSTVAPVELLPMLEDVLADVAPVAAEAQVRLETDAADLFAAPVRVADSGLRLRRALRAALVRAITAARQSRGEGILSLTVLADGEHQAQSSTTGAQRPERAPPAQPLVRLRLSGMRTRPHVQDLERMLSPLGGGAGHSDGALDDLTGVALEDVAGAAALDAPARADGEELWLWLRRA